MSSAAGKRPNYCCERRHTKKSLNIQFLPVIMPLKGQEGGNPRYSLPVCAFGADLFSQYCKGCEKTRVAVDSRMMTLCDCQRSTSPQNQVLLEIATLNSHCEGTGASR